jgi:putative transposase
MENKRWTTSNKAVYNLGYHIIWCPKYRRKLLTNSVETRLKELLYKKADELGLTIETCEIMPDHVHLFIKSSPVDSPHFIVQQLKGYTSIYQRNSDFLKTDAKHVRVWNDYTNESLTNVLISTGNLLMN